MHAVLAERPPAAPVLPRLSLALREATRAEHLAVEDAFALDARLADRASYAALLRTLRGVQAAHEDALAALDGWAALAPRLDPAARRRAHLLDADLAALGEEPAAPHGPPVALPTLAHGLGCLYVLEGSALGGRIAARQARRALGDDLPLAFLTSTGRADLGADWRALQTALDAFGAGCGTDARADVVTAARTTFTTLTAWLRREGARA